MLRIVSIIQTISIIRIRNFIATLKSILRRRYRNSCIDFNLTSFHNYAVDILERDNEDRDTQYFTDEPNVYKQIKKAELYLIYREGSSYLSFLPYEQLMDVSKLC